MIPLRLQEGIKKRLEKLFENNKFQRPAIGEESESEIHYSKLNIFSQNLPIQEHEDQTFFPMAIVKLNKGGQSKGDGKHLVNVSIIAGTFDANKNQDGYRDVAQILTAIMEHFKKSPIIEGLYELDFDSPIDWELSEEETFPYYFGGLSLHFKIPILEFGGRQDLEGFNWQ